MVVGLDWRVWSDVQGGILGNTLGESLEANRLLSGLQREVLVPGRRHAPEVPSRELNFDLTTKPSYLALQVLWDNIVFIVFSIGVLRRDQQSCSIAGQGRRYVQIRSLQPAQS